jgi:predicted RNase H-like HicB family nuclease
MDNQYTILVRREGVKYLAVCLELNIASRGASLDEAQDNVVQAIKAWLVDERAVAQPEASSAASDLICEFLLAQTRLDELVERFSLN